MQASSPYRTSARAELVVGARPLVTVVLWTAWLAALAFAVLMVAVDDPVVLRLAVVGIVACAAAAIVVGRMAARRVRWRFVLSQRNLTLERLTGRDAETVATFDVSDGLFYEIAVPPGPSLDARIILMAKSQRVPWVVGARPDAALERVTRFLERRGVVVEQRS